MEDQPGQYSEILSQKETKQTSPRTGVTGGCQTPDVVLRTEPGSSGRIGVVLS